MSKRKKPIESFKQCYTCDKPTKNYRRCYSDKCFTSGKVFCKACRISCTCEDAFCKDCSSDFSKCNRG